jgi:hypothetical protein
LVSIGGANATGGRSDATDDDDVGESLAALVSIGAESYFFSAPASGEEESRPRSEHAASNSRDNKTEKIRGKVVRFMLTPLEKTEIECLYETNQDGEWGCTKQ